MSGIILSALAGAGEGATGALDQQQRRDDKIAEQNNAAGLQLQNETTLLQRKMEIADQVRQAQVARVDQAAQPILDQGVVDRAATARAMQLPQYSGDAAGPASFHGDAGQTLALINALPEGPDKQAALAQLKSNVTANRPALAMGDLTAEERAAFAPRDADVAKAMVAAAIKTGDIAPEKVMENATKEGGVDAKLAMVDQQLQRSQLLHEAYTARTEAQFNAAMAKLQQSNTLTPEMDQVAQGIASGKLAPLSGYALRTPGASMIMSRVLELNPEYDATQFGTRQKAEKEFTSGKLGNQARSFNVALAHLDTLSSLADALDNGDMRIINQVANSFASATGGPAPTNFETAKQLVADEIVKAIVGAGGSAGDREKAQEVISKANSPAQLKGAINTYQELMAGQLRGLEQQYKTSTSKDDFRERLLSPEVQVMMDRFSKTGATPTRISTDAEFNALPSGTAFIGPDGVPRRKP